MTRPDWHEYFMSIAEAVAARGTCDRLRVGAVLVDTTRRILATGYNGAPSSQESCDDAGHLMIDVGGRQSCVRTVHAEENAILDCARRGVSCNGAILYTTASTCYDCLKRCAQAGIFLVYYRAEYSSARSAGLDIPKLATQMGVGLVRVPPRTVLVTTALPGQGE